MRPGLYQVTRRTYGPGGGSPAYSARRIKQLLRRYGLDTRQAHPWVYDLEGLSHFRQAGMQELFAALRIRRSHRVLSLGEGHGAPSRLLAKTVGCRVTGVDILPRQVRTAREMARWAGLSGRLDYVRQDVQRLDLGRRRFDRLYINETMCTWPDQVSALRHAARHLKPGALAGINEWLAGDEGDLDDAHRAQTSFRKVYEKGIWFQVDLKGLRRVFEAAGFEVLSALDVTRQVDATMRRRLEALRAYSRLLARDEASAIGYHKAILKTHFRFLRYARLTARLPGR